MSHGSLLAKTGTSISREIQESFRAAFRGEMIHPGDAGYDRGRTIWNASVDNHPGVIVRPTGVADVV